MKNVTFTRNSWTNLHVTSPHLRFCGIENPDEKIGGIIYAFIRGIRKDDPKPFGVFTARPPKALIACLDDFFENGYHEGSVNAYAQTAQLEGTI